MIIPIRCISCGKPVGHLWEPLKEMTEKQGVDKKEALDKLGAKRYCCRALLLSHVDIIDIISQYKKA